MVQAANRWYLFKAPNDSTVKAKKRYLIGYNLPLYEDAWRGKTEITAKCAGSMEFWIPKGANRFHFTGGARFIHGGAMPQEIAVPVITVRQAKGEKALEKTKTKPPSKCRLNQRCQNTP
ncbi:MAG: hypothetical protein R3C56_40035 [Pirellulaceae bacterium]